MKKERTKKNNNMQNEVYNKIKNNLQDAKYSERGITLIALVITIIVLIILAGISISLILGENGLLSKAKKGVEDYQYAGLKERIESEILALDMEKVVKGETLTIQDALIELQANGTFEEIDIDSNTGVCEGYVIELGYNTDGKVVINGITKDTGTRIATKVSPTGYTNGKVEVTISVKTNGQNVSSIEVEEGMTQKQGTEEKDHIYEVEKNGTYHVKATLDDGTNIEKDIVIATIDTLPPKKFTITAENTGTGIIVKAETQDAEADDTSAKSGIDRYEYYVKKKQEAETDYTKYDTNEIKDLESGTYNIYAVAYDKAGNETQSDLIEIEIQLKIKFQQIAAGYYHSLGIDMDGNLWTWGDNGYGQLGDGTKQDSFKPKKVIVESNPEIKFQQVAAGYGHSLAIDIEGNLWTWGYNNYGQLGNGDGTGNNSNTPKQITVQSSPEIKFQQVEAGTYHSVAIDVNGYLWVWGCNRESRLGLGTQDTSRHPDPTRITIASNPELKFKQITAGNQHNLAIDENDNLWVWGYNQYGQLGIGKNSSIPEQVTLEKNPQRVAAEAGHSLMIDVDGTLYTWGYNNYGQLGNGTINNQSSPTKITVASDANVKFKQIVGGENHSLAIDSNGKIWAWGYNSNGQLGNGTNEQQDKAVTVEFNNQIEFKQIAAGANHSLAIDKDGNLWGWGDNQYGQLGNGTNSSSTIPIPIAQ